MLNRGFEAEIRIKEVTINSAKSTVIECSRETQRKGNTCTFDYVIKVMNNHAGTTLTRPTETTFSHINAR